MEAKVSGVERRWAVAATPPYHSVMQEAPAMDGNGWMDGDSVDNRSMTSSLPSTIAGVSAYRRVSLWLYTLPDCLLCVTLC